MYTLSSNSNLWMEQHIRFSFEKSLDSYINKFILFLIINYIFPLKLKIKIIK